MKKHLHCSKCSPSSWFKACEILGQCIFLHENIKGSHEAENDIKQALSFKQLLAVLGNHAKRRLFMWAGRAKPILIEPVKPMTSEDPVTMRIRKKRRKTKRR